MPWEIYQVVLRLRSPMHIGWGKVGNVQRTRHYVIGRALWGAFTQRLTRDRANGKGPATDSIIYRTVGNEIHQSLAYTYFYVALKRDDGYELVWPWEANFRSRFLSSYASTALTYPYQSADESTLHDIEFLSPNALDNGEAIFLSGYVFQQNDVSDWRSALQRIQLGGERGYGWGHVDLVKGFPKRLDHATLFDGAAIFQELDSRPIIHVNATEEKPGHLLAHANPAGLQAKGEVEPVVGREWRSDQQHNRYAGQHVALSGVCFTPGTVLTEPSAFEIGEFGIWKKANGNPPQNE